MPCYKPVYGSYARGKFIPTGGHAGDTAMGSVSFGTPMSVPCGRCIGCRLENSRQWAVRMMHEAQMHDEVCFLTLTYDNDHVPEDYGLVKDEFPLFMKRLRKEISKGDDGPYGHRQVSYFHCGEYGDERKRPHYHAAMFGIDWHEDRVLARMSKGGYPLLCSPRLNKTWGKGEVTIGDLTFESAAYIARYVTKKVTGAKAETHYERVDSETGEIYSVEPEFATMSRNPAIGKRWIEKFHEEVFSHDEVISRGVPAKPPRYYDKFHEKIDPEAAEAVRRKRMRAFDAREGTASRLGVREVCAEAGLSLTPRGDV
jgi:hypothetical protein